MSTLVQVIVHCWWRWLASGFRKQICFHGNSIMFLWHNSGLWVNLIHLFNDLFFYGKMFMTIKSTHTRFHNKNSFLEGFFLFKFKQP